MNKGSLLRVAAMCEDHTLASNARLHAEAHTANLLECHLMPLIIVSDTDDAAHDDPERPVASTRRG